MKSPFPGMDPYLEDRWSDVHARLVIYVSEALQPRLPEGLRARSEQEVLLETSDPQEDPEEQSFNYRPDVAVINTSRRASRTAPREAGGVAVLEPIGVTRFPGPQRHRWVQIIDTNSHNRIVTVIEILSPSNKASGIGHKNYLKKLRHYEEAEVSVVEIDLLRHPGRGRLEVGQVDLPLHRQTPYLTLVRKGWDPLHWWVYPMPLRQPLPAIPIPLRTPEEQVILELQPIIERAYAAGGHDDINYDLPPNEPLSPEDAAWAKTLTRRE